VRCVADGMTQSHHQDETETLMTPRQLLERPENTTQCATHVVWLVSGPTWPEAGRLAGESLGLFWVGLHTCGASGESMHHRLYQPSPHTHSGERQHDKQIPPALPANAIKFGNKPVLQQLPVSRSSEVIIGSRWEWDGQTLCVTDCICDE